MKLVKHKLLRFIIIGIVAGLLYPIFSDGFERYIAFVNGLTIGLIGATFVAVLEVKVFETYWKSKNFLLTALMKAAIYSISLLVIIVLVKGFNDSLYYSTPFFEYLTGEQFNHFLFEEDLEMILLYAMVIVGLIILWGQISRKMGEGVLTNFVTGKYYTPQKENIILMFVDLKSSTEITTHLGPRRYHQFINEFYQDIAEPIYSNKAKIYRYVGDQIALFWDMKNDANGRHCINLYFQMKDNLEKLGHKYQNKYGRQPYFRASCHTGELVLGEIGDVKSQIVFHGQPLYECDYIERKCKDLGEDFLVSSTLLEQLDLQEKYKAERVIWLITGANYNFDLLKLERIN